MPPVRIELTTFRLWDWRATYCAKEAPYNGNPSKVIVVTTRTRNSRTRTPYSPGCSGCSRSESQTRECFSLSPVHPIPEQENKIMNTADRQTDGQTDMQTDTCNATCRCGSQTCSRVALGRWGSNIIKPYFCLAKLLMSPYVFQSWRATVDNS